MTTDEVAEMLRVSTETVKNYRRLKVDPIPYIKLSGGAIRFRREAVEQWLREREQGKECSKT